MYSTSHNSEIMTNNKAGEVIKELFESILNGYKIELKTSMRDSDFIFDCVHLFYYIRHKNKSKSWWIIYRFS